MGRHKAMGREHVDASGPQQAQHLGLHPTPKRAGQMGRLKNDQRAHIPQKLGYFPVWLLFHNPIRSKFATFRFYVLEFV
jgi:hypothetical protein